MPDNRTIKAAGDFPGLKEKFCKCDGQVKIITIDTESGEQDYFCGDCLPFELRRKTERLSRVEKPFVPKPECSSCLNYIPPFGEVLEGPNGPICGKCDEDETQDSYDLLGLCPHGVADDGDCEDCGGSGGSDNYDSPWD